MMRTTRKRLMSRRRSSQRKRRGRHPLKAMTTKKERSDVVRKTVIKRKTVRRVEMSLSRRRPKRRRKANRLTRRRKHERRLRKKKRKKIEKAPPKPKPKPKENADQTLTAAQKKKRIEEKNALERNRINQMKHSSEPVWKQNLAKSGGANVSAGASTGSLETQKPRQSTSNASSPRGEETKLQRAIRLSKLIDMRLKAEEGKRPADFETAGIIKVMRKARNMDLSLSEWMQSTIIELISNLRKHSNAEIAAEAKEIRSHLKVKVAAASAD
mmetsp:Transcript_14940/g.24710  ORF Transcript_14940/g.24710 Transcript_14940/m.24710 type:complete len:270 (-) Transcript_14940:136-945(-)